MLGWGGSSSEALKVSYVPGLCWRWGIQRYTRTAMVFALMKFLSNRKIRFLPSRNSWLVETKRRVSKSLQYSKSLHVWPSWQQKEGSDQFPWTKQQVRGNLPEEFACGHPGHQWQSQISHMGFSILIQCFLCFDFHCIPGGQRKEMGKVRRLRKNSPDNAREAHTWF